jgi:hypothetical protein
MNDGHYEIIESNCTLKSYKIRVSSSSLRIPCGPDDFYKDINIYHYS